MAGAGYKLFATGDVLTAAEVNTYLQQQVTMVFADSSARTTALSAVLAEGMMSYLQDTNTVEVYNGSNWVNVGNTGDVTEVQAGTGISVADGTGPIPIVTNTMATEITAKGDLIVGTGSGTFDNLPAGTNGFTLVADSSTATGLAYAAPAGGITFADYTPSYTNITIGNGTVAARYGQQGKFVFVIWDLVFGSTSSIGSASRVSLPKTAKNTTYIGSMYGLDAGTLEVIGQVSLGSSTEMKMTVPLNGSYGTAQPTATFPWTWTTNDRITLSLVYEEA